MVAGGILIPLPDVFAGWSYEGGEAADNIIFPLCKVSTII
jgi:hypothetical protein